MKQTTVSEHVVYSTLSIQDCIDVLPLMEKLAQYLEENCGEKNPDYFKFGDGSILNFVEVLNIYHVLHSLGFASRTHVPATLFKRYEEA